MSHDHHDHDDDCNRTHPKDRAPKADDPMEMSGIEVDGDPEVMLDCIVEEYARMGCDADAILRMFDDPFFEGPHGLTKAYGREYIRRRVEGILHRSGVLRVRVIEQPVEEVDDHSAAQQVILTVGGRAIAERIWS